MHAKRILSWGALLCLFACGSAHKKTTPVDAASFPPLAPQNNLLQNADFRTNPPLPWMFGFLQQAAGEGSIMDGAYCLEVFDKGVNPYDARIFHREMTIQKGHTYYVGFKMWATRPMQIKSVVGSSVPPYTAHWEETFALTTEPKMFYGRFTMSSEDDYSGEFAIQAGGDLVDGIKRYTVCIDDVFLSDPDFTRLPKKAPMPVSQVLVNQVGYLPQFKKIATVKNEATSPLAWTLLNSERQPVAAGQTLVHGHDRSSDEPVHVIDFSSFQTVGKGYRLKVGEALSHPFDIDSSIYKRMKYDALAYFYHNRSGIPIEMPYAGDPKWTRPAGHLSDKAVPCLPESGCTYSLDVTKGWYDAGDHGKYVVNGGISVWTLLNLYERGQFLNQSTDAFGDGTLNIPENKNGVPDLLDEARWEIEFLLNMQVPEGNPKAGMAHHKVHDKEWTGLGLAPHEDTMPRYLHPPSTTATLNLAATAAQASRIWREFDPAFSSKCLKAATAAWKAAQTFPAERMSEDSSKGGGAYSDSRFADEFYWAAAELFVTTGEEMYREYIQASPFFEQIPSTWRNLGDNPSAMDWQNVESLGNLSLAIVPNKLKSESIERIRANVVTTADSFLLLVEKEGYRFPYRPGATNIFHWGSNSFVLNNLIILALAYDFSKERQYLDGVICGMDYILGRNPLDQSYVTGYGERALKHPHHRFWAEQAHPKFPPPPPGAVSGGPNSALQDPLAKAAGLKGCAPTKCFVDHIEAWSVNEVTINWNAPFAWSLFFLDEHKTTESPKEMPAPPAASAVKAP